MPIAFEVYSLFRVELLSRGLGGIRLIEESERPPYFKDYGRLDGHERWARGSWDLSSWIFLGAFRKRERIGGAIIAFHVDGMNYCERRLYLAGLRDIRVRPEYRGLDIGKSLFQIAETCARNRGCNQLKVETQKTNVAA